MKIKIFCILLIVLIFSSCTVIHDDLGQKEDDDDFVIEKSYFKDTYSNESIYDYEEFSDYTTVDDNYKNSQINNLNRSSQIPYIKTLNSKLIYHEWGQLYNIDFETGKTGYSCLDPICDHLQCVFGPNNNIMMSLFANGYKEAGNRIYVLRHSELLDNEIIEVNGTLKVISYEIISFDLDGKNVKMHYSTKQSVFDIYLIDETLLYFTMQDYDTGLWMLCKLDLVSGKMTELNKPDVLVANVFKIGEYTYYQQVRLFFRFKNDDMQNAEIISDQGSVGHTFFWNNESIFFRISDEIKGEHAAGHSRLLFKLMRYDCQKGELTVIAENVRDYYLTSDYIYFSPNLEKEIENPNENGSPYIDWIGGKIYRMDHDGNNVELIRDDEDKIYYNSYYILGDYIYSVSVPYMDDMYNFIINKGNDSANMILGRVRIDQPDKPYYVLRKPE